LQYREAGGRGDKNGHRKKRACHSVFPFTGCGAEASGSARMYANV
jgi:hypothetical protein